MLEMNVNVTLFNKDNLKGLASVQIHDELRLNGIRIMESEEGKLFVSLPSYKSKSGEYVQYYHPVTKEFHDALNEKVLSAYNLVAEGKRPERQESMQEQVKISSMRVTPYEKDSIKGLATVVVNDSLAINSIKVMKGQYGLYPTMPTYKSGDGEYHEIVECGQELKKNIKTEIRKAMNDLKKDEKPVEEKQEVKPVPKRKPKAKSR